MYTTTANIEAKLGTSLTSSQTTYFNDVLDDAIDAYINFKTETQFNSQTALDVYVSSNGGSTLVIPTMHTITSVEKVSNDGTEEAVSSDDYYAYPRGLSEKKALMRINGSWTEGFDRYKINAILGYATVPADIEMIATELAINALNEPDNNYKSEKVGDWSVTYAEIDKSISYESKEILSSYRRLSRRT